MKGLELSRRYYEVYGAPMLAEQFPEYAPRIAAGLAGFGSECFGYDDELSADHDYGPGFCLWLLPEDFRAAGAAIQAAYDALPGSFLGVPARRESFYAGQRVGVFSIPDFYGMFLGPYQPPETAAEWFRIPEKNLAAAVSGTVFADGAGAFTGLREALLAYYPRDVWLKKISARLCVMAQSGQYNYSRCLRRGDTAAARLALGEFLREAVALAHLLCRRYMPFYKWAFRSMGELPLPPGLDAQLRALAEAGITAGPEDKNADRIEAVCALFTGELARRGLTGCCSDFLLDHGREILGEILDPVIRQMNMMKG